MRTARATFTLPRSFSGRLWSAAIDHSPLDVVAWHGNYAPYKYDLALFNCINTVSLRSSRSIDLHRAEFAFRSSRHGQLRLRDLSSALDGRRAHLPPALVPSQPDERVHGPDLRRLRCQGRGLRARRRQPAQLHGRPRSGRRNLRARQQRRAQAAVPRRIRWPSCSRRSLSFGPPSSP